MPETKPEYISDPQLEKDIRDKGLIRAVAEYEKPIPDQFFIEHSKPLGRG